MVNKMEQRLLEQAVNSIRKVTREHKNNCNSEDCGVQTYLIGLLVKEAIGRELTSEEWEDFI